MPWPSRCSTDGALDSALAGGAVVAEEVDEQRVVQGAEFLEGVDESSDLVVGVLGETGEGLHEPGRQCPLGVGQLVPMRHAVGPRGQLGVG